MLKEENIKDTCLWKFNRQKKNAASFAAAFQLHIGVHMRDCMGKKEGKKDGREIKDFLKA